MIVHLQSTFIFVIVEFLYLSKSFYFFPAQTVVKGMYHHSLLLNLCFVFMKIQHYVEL